MSSKATWPRCEFDQDPANEDSPVCGRLARWSAETVHGTSYWCQEHRDHLILDGLSAGRDEGTRWRELDWKGGAR